MLIVPLRPCGQQSNVEDSMELMALILRRFGLLTRTHREFKNVHLWQDYFCTGVVLGKGAYATVFLGRHVKTAKVPFSGASSLRFDGLAHQFLRFTRLSPSRRWIGII
jgi:hypothetical protein